MKSAEAQLFEISRQLSPSQRRQWMDYGVRLRTRKPKKPAAPKENGDDVWERIIADPRPRPKLAAAAEKVRADLKAGKHFPASHRKSMISEPRPEFWECYHRLSPETKTRARKAFALFLQNPWHPSLRFKLLKGYPDVWSVRVGLQYRAVGVRDGDIIQWFWIGTHNDFDLLF